MELQKTPITYQQASEVLGVSLETIKKAVLRGVLTRLPREGLYQHLMAGQVELFKGKTLSLSVLSENGRKLWQAYADSMEHMLQDERESWRLLLVEAQREGEFSMNINSLQGEARRAYDNRPAEEAAAWAQVIAQCEIAQQLARIATQLEDGQIATLEGVNIVERLSRIAIGIESLNTGI